MPEALESIIIIGGGCFGLSAAWSLTKGRYAGHGHLVTVFDRSPTPPALDAASSDYNKIVRQDYCDETWASLAHQAIETWSTPEWAPYFSQSGCMVVSSLDHPRADYVRSAFVVNSDPSLGSNGRMAVELPTTKDIEKVFGSSIPMGDFDRTFSYINPNSGWGHARRAMDMICDKVREAGVRIVGDEVLSLAFGEKNGKTDVVGVKTASGTYTADKVILAAGSWSAKFVPEIGKELLATGQVVAHVQLSEEEAQRYAHVPVVFRMDSGFYVFPPTPEGIVKFAIHGPGWVNPQDSLPSVPRKDATELPPEAVPMLQAELEKTYPELAKKPWCETRICWYCDSPSSDWLMDYSPRYASLFVAAGDSGHAFKFLPTIGDLIVAALDRKLVPKLARLFSWDNLTSNKGDPSRGGAESFERRRLAPQPKL